jgi:tRNA G18 (ribose-2'-O)-methylase SpoU
LFRTAQILNADFLFIIGNRFKKHSADTMKAYRHLPVYSYDNFDDFNEHRPYNCKLIGIELMENAIMLNDYKHPKQACYLLGSEDNGLTKKAIVNCQDIIKLPGERSMNVSVAGSIVIYDRIIKQRS